MRLQNEKTNQNIRQKKYQLSIPSQKVKVNYGHRLWKKYFYHIKIWPKLSLLCSTNTPSAYIKFH